MADELKEEFGVEAMLTAGSGGIFDVVVDGDLVFSRDQTGRFPQPGEIVENLKS